MRTLLKANIGEIVKIREDNIPTEFIVIQKGDPFLNNAKYENGIYILPKDIPSPTYVGFRHGVTLLRKDIHSVGSYGAYGIDYANSDVHKWCNTSYLNLIQEDIRNQIMDVRIPYKNNVNDFVCIGHNGLKCKVFLLSTMEVNTPGDNSLNEGVVFSYFKEDEINKRIANFNDSPDWWWLRSQSIGYKLPYWITQFGTCGFYYDHVKIIYGRRPAFVLPESLSIDHEGNVMV